VLAQRINSLSGKITRALAPEMRMLSVAQHAVPSLQRELERLERFATTRNTYYYCACTIE
jgi:hypothetical protein